MTQVTGMLMDWAHSTDEGINETTMSEMNSSQQQK
jgi:hypothetical protein